MRHTALYVPGKRDRCVLHWYVINITSKLGSNVSAERYLDDDYCNMSPFRSTLQPGGPKPRPASSIN